MREVMELFSYYENLSNLIDKLRKPNTFPITVNLLILANFNWTSKHDTDNIVKPIIDLLVKAEIIPDDNTRYINEINVRHLQGFGPPVVSISLES